MSNIIFQINVLFVELCFRDNATKYDSLIEDPPTIIVLIIRKIIIFLNEFILFSNKNKDIRSISNLNNIKIILFRHQQILMILIKIIIFIIYLISTSKVGVFKLIIENFFVSWGFFYYLQSAYTYDWSFNIVSCNLFFKYLLDI